MKEVYLLENNHDLALLTLAQLLQLSYDNFDVEVIQIDTPSANLMYDDIAPILNYAMQNRNEIKVAESDIELAKLGTKISKSAYLPNISMGYGFSASANFSNLTEDDQFIDQLKHLKFVGTKAIQNLLYSFGSNVSGQQYAAQYVQQQQ